MNIPTKALLLSLWFILKYVLGIAIVIGTIAATQYILTFHADMVLPIALTFGAIVLFAVLYFTTLEELEIKEQKRRSMERRRHRETENDALIFPCACDEWTGDSTNHLEGCPKEKEKIKCQL